MPARPFRESFRFAWAGLTWAWRTQGNLRRHTVAALIVLVFTHLLALPRTERAIIVLTIALVITAELVNTVVEVVVDLSTTEYHPLAKQAKDVAAAFVLTAALAAVIVGLYLLGPPLLQLA
ncbi:MAG: diacylglycerol kinase family protein, partial [bacterium]